MMIRITVIIATTTGCCQMNQFTLQINVHHRTMYPLDIGIINERYQLQLCVGHGIVSGNTTRDHARITRGCDSINQGDL